MCVYVCVGCIVLQQHFPAALSSCYCTGFPAAAFYRLSSSLTNQITTSNLMGTIIILVLLYKIPVPGNNQQSKNCIQYDIMIPVLF